MWLQGRQFGEGVLERIRSAVATGACRTRSALSRQVCEWLDWRSSTGRLKEAESRKALLALEREGLIELPAATRVPGRWAPGANGVPVVPETASVACDLGALGRIDLVRVEGSGSPEYRIWQGLLTAHHPQGAGVSYGRQVRYLVRSEVYGWLGGVGFGASAWQLRARDQWIGWSGAAREAQLQAVVGNTRWLLVPTVRVPHLASHVLGQAVRQMAADWEARYGVRPLLVETFVDEERYAGACYRAANWVRVGTTTGRGRQGTRLASAVRGVYLYPLQPDWRQRLCQEPPRVLGQAVRRGESLDWAEEEFSRLAVADGRLRQRVMTVARDFFGQPQSPIPQACGSAARTRAAYRLFQHPRLDMDLLLRAHTEATLERVRGQRRVLAVQDTTTLNYTAHPATAGLGPIGTAQQQAVGLIVHDTLAFTEDGTPLGLLEVQCWARDPEDVGKGARRKSLPIAEKESRKWLDSYRRVAEIQRLCPDTELISVGDREADIYELFLEAHRHGNTPQLLVRADRGRQRQVAQGPLWEQLPQQPLAGWRNLALPGRGGRPPRTARLTVRFAAVTLQPPKDLAGQPALPVWAIYTHEPAPPPGTEPLEWLILTTLPTATFDDACARLENYARRWGIEVYHRTLKSGCRIEDRRLENADSLKACLAIDLVVAWRILYLTLLARQTPEAPCTVAFAAEEWQALMAFTDRTPDPPPQPPTLRTAVRRVASLGGFLGRKRDGEPGPTTLWRGLQRLQDITAAFVIFRSNRMCSGP